MARARCAGPRRGRAGLRDREHRLWRRRALRRVRLRTCGRVCLRGVWVAVKVSEESFLESCVFNRSVDVSGRE